MLVLNHSLRTTLSTYTIVATDSYPTCNKWHVCCLDVRVICAFNSVRWDYNCAATWENVPSSTCTQCRLESAFSPTQSDQDFHSPHKETASLEVQNAFSEDSDQPTGTHGLIWIFNGTHVRRYVFWHCRGQVRVYTVGLLIHWLLQWTLVTTTAFVPKNVAIIMNLLL